MPATKDNKELLQIALKTAELAQANILKYFQTDVGVEWKADKTPVTIADKSTEELAREFWAKETPGFGVIGEEFGIESPDAEYQWVIDPIDGTKSFVRGVPLFGTLIALYRRDVPVCSVVRIPAMNTAVWAVNGGGAFLVFLETLYDARRYGYGIIPPILQSLQAYRHILVICIDGNDGGVSADSDPPAVFRGHLDVLVHRDHYGKG